jgi:hypothetical protein
MEGSAGGRLKRRSSIRTNDPRAGPGGGAARLVAFQAPQNLGPGKLGGNGGLRLDEGKMYSPNYLTKVCAHRIQP